MSFTDRLRRALPTDGDLRALVIALAAVIPVYMVLSILTGLILSKRLSHGLDKLPPGVVSSVETRVDGATRTGLVGALLSVVDPKADDQIRVARSVLADPAIVPKADTEASSQARRQLHDSVFAKLFGFEQFVCYVLAVWALLMLLARLRCLREDGAELSADPLVLQPGQLVDPATAQSLHQPLLAFRDRGESETLCRVLSRALLRFETAREVAAAESVVNSEANLYADARDADLGLVRFAAWAIPSVGFIGTVRGIGSALAVADSPDNIGEIVSFLAVAFDTTLIALLLSIVVMYVLHHYQRINDSMTERLIRRCDDLLIGHLTTHEPSAPRTGQSEVGG